jgi:predicted dehydrogenase
MPDKIGVAFVGCTHPHIFPRVQLLSGQADVWFAGCYDPDVNLMNALERDHGLKAYATPEELLDQPGVNFAIIEGWEPDNPRYVEMAAARGQAILLEKPGAPNLPEMQRVVEAVRGKNIPFQVGYMLRFGSGVAHAQRILAEGVLGPVTLARFHAATPVGGSKEIWQSIPGDLGGLMYTDACHAIHLMTHILGMPSRVQSMHLKFPAGQDVIAHGFKPDTLSGLGHTVNMPLGGLVHEDVGASLFDYGDKLVTLDMTGWEAHPWVEAWAIELYGTDGTLFVGIQPPRYKLYVRNANHGYGVGWHNWESFDASTVGNSLTVDENYTGEIMHMLGRVRAWDTDNSLTLTEAENVVTVLDAMHRSNHDGKVVVIEGRA